MRFFRSHRKSALPDEEIVARYKAMRDRELVGLLFDRHAHLVFGICFNYLKDEEKSKDAVLALFEKLFDALLRHEVRHFGAWLHAVARNHCLAELERIRKEHILAAGADRPEAMEDEYDSPPDDKLHLLPEALAAIGPEQKRCIEMFYLANLSYREIAVRTGMPYDRVRSHIQNGKRNLRKRLNGKP
jgi:RNA polymerase sigma-70 factor (ECF subfamily)